MNVFSPNTQMTAKWWWDPETFNEQYQAKVDEVIKNMYMYDSRYNPETQTFRLSNGHVVLVKKAEYYRPPPELIEFCNSIDKIYKPHASGLEIKKAIPYCVLRSFWDQDVQVNYMDWVGFLGSEGFTYLYMNCNPQSKHYGHIMIANADGHHCEITHKKLHELTADICKWMSVTSDFKSFDVEEFLNSRAEAYSFPRETTHRDILMLRDVSKPIQLFQKGIYDHIEYSTRYTDYEAEHFIDWIYACLNVKN
jgi:hypothetical protein